LRYANIVVLQKLFSGQTSWQGNAGNSVWDERCSFCRQQIFAGDLPVPIKDVFEVSECDLCPPVLCWFFRGGK